MPKQNDNMIYLKAEANSAVDSDKKKRILNAVVLSEAPVKRYDYSMDKDIVLYFPMSGFTPPSNSQVPLLDDHNSYGADSVKGSARNLRVDKDRVLAEVHFAEGTDAVWQKYMDGHLTDFSAGICFDNGEIVQVGESAELEIDGKTYKGPAKIYKKWEVVELSMTPIGANRDAKKLSNKNKEKEAKTMTDGKESEVPVEDAPVDGEKIRLKAQVKERERITEINAIGLRYGIDSTIVAEAVESGMAVEEMRKKVDKVFDDKERQVPNTLDFVPSRDVATYGADPRDKFKSAAGDALQLRLKMGVEKPAPGATDLRGFSLVELCRESVYLATGKRAPGNKHNVIKLALTQSDLPHLLDNVMGKVLVDRYNVAPETWREWCSTGSVPDFKINSRVRLSEFSDLDELSDNAGPYQFGSIGDGREQYAIAVYGKKFAITRPTFINDDLEGLRDALQVMARASARKIGDLAYAVLTSNPLMGDDKALFHADHGNLAAGSDKAPPGVDTLHAMDKAFGDQKDSSGVASLNLNPEILILPRYLKGQTETFLKSARYADEGTPGTPDEATAATRVNIYSGDYFQRVYETRLNNASVTAWYGATRYETVRIFFLDGQEEPFLDTQDGWDVDGVEYKVRIEACAKALGWKELYRNPGA